MKLALASAFVLLSACLFLLGCGSGSNLFESDDPTYRPPVTSSGGFSSDAGAASSDAAAPVDPGGAQRAIEEADVIKVVGTRLYALSRYGGLSVVEIGTRDKLTLLGRYRMEATPFEMYVENDVVYAMLSSYGRWNAGQWVATSEVLALDAKDPTNITKLTTFDIPGTISDSRMVGEVMYVVSYRNGTCWMCEVTPSTTVTSFHVSPNEIRQIDQIDYAAPSGYGYWQRSVTVTPSRMYVAGPEWGAWQPQGSVIQIIDISDPTGHMKKGADVPVQGSITSRWQMDELGGVLRVISQPWAWSAGIVNPKVQTFRVQSSTSIVPLGQTDIVLPMREALQSVRFDGTRAYAITVERKDPLFTIDLTDPAKPKQVGQLQMPGWVYFMEPRGDRLVGLGFDTTNGAGMLNVSLFDVSDLAKPTMIKRVSFGQGWSQVPEDQNRIQKAFEVLDADGMILVPFASYARWSGTSCSKGESGIQIIDYSHDDLTLRGVAAQEGQPRRTFLWDARLFAMSDRHVTTFDIADRDAPAKKVEMDLSTPAHRVTTVGSNVVELSDDWWTGEATLAVVPKNGADGADILGRISLAELAPSPDWRCAWRNAWTEWYNAKLFPHGEHVVIAVPVRASNYGYGYGYGGSSSNLIVGVVDLRDPSKPTLVGKTVLPLAGYATGAYYYGSGSVMGSGADIVKVGNTLAYLETHVESVMPEWGATVSLVASDTRTSRVLRLVDLSDPTAPTSRSIDLGTTSRGATPLLVSGTTVLTSRWDPIASDPKKAHFYVDRVDLADPRSPRRLESVNVPGSLVLANGSRWVTVDYHRVERVTTGSCNYGMGDSYEDGKCISFERSLNLVDVVDAQATLRQKLLPRQNLSGVLASEDRIYLTMSPTYELSYTNGVARQEMKEGGLAVYGQSEGTLALVADLTGARRPAAVDGTRVALAEDDGAGFYDTATGSLREIGRLRTSAYTTCEQVLIEGDHALCTLGERGVRTVALRP